MKKITAYLSGAIDMVADRGVQWRKDFATALDEIDIKALIPNDIDIDDGLPERIKELKNRRNLKKFKKVYRKSIVIPDLLAVSACDIVIVRWDGETTVGTFHECGQAFTDNQPLFLVTPRPFTDVPNWLLAIVDKEFHTIEELTKYLASKPKKFRGKI